MKVCHTICKRALFFFFKQKIRKKKKFLLGLGLSFAALTLTAALWHRMK